MKCHWDFSILKAHFIYYIAPPYTHLLFVKHAHDYECCYRSTALHNLQYDHFLIFLCILTVVDVAPLSHDSLPERWVTAIHTLLRIPSQPLSHTHTAAVGLMVQWWRNECWVSLKGHFGSLWAFVCFCMCKLAVSGKLHNEGVDGVCPVPAWWCRAVTGWYKGLHCCQTLSQSVHCLQAKGFKPIN